MKLKQVLMGGLLLTVPFAACTNEELMDVTVPSTPEEVLSQAVSLGDDFTIVGEKGVSTKAIIKDDLSGSIWEKTDTVGGAWYAMYNPATETGEYIDAANKKLFSNHPFAFNKDLGGMTKVEFKANTNAFAGKYLLYYPYDNTVAAVSAEIPVEFEQNPEMDCTAGKELDHVNRNLFAWCDAEFKEGGSQAGTFELKQAGNVVVIKLGSTSANIDRIQGKAIEKVILESSNALYNKAKIVADDSKTAYKDMVGKYEAGNAVSTYILTPKNAGDDYKITAADAAGMTKKAFYLSMLPAKADIASLTVRVIMSDGRVYKKDLTKTANADLFAKLIKPAQKLVMDVVLDTEENANNIYTAEQFNAALAKAATETAPVTIPLAADITLPSLDFNMRGKSVTISGNSLNVTGGLTVTDGNLTISSKLIAKDKVTVGEYGNLTVNGTGNELGALKVDGAANVKAGKVASAEVTKAAKLELEGAEVAGSFTIGRAADVTLNGVTLKGATTNNAGVIKLATAASNNNGTFTSTDGSIDAVVALNNNASMTLSGTTVSGTAGIENKNNATLNVNGAAATISALNNVAEVTSPVAKAAGVVNVEMAAADTELTVPELANNGKLNIKKGKLKVKNTTPANILGATSETVILKDGVLNIEQSGVGTANARVVIVKNENVVKESGADFASDVVIATEVSSAAGNWIANLATDAGTVILNASNMSLNATTHAALLSKNLILKQNIKLTSNFTMTINGTLNVEGNVTISADAAATLTLNGTNSIEGVLTIGNNVTLTGTATIKLNNGAGRLTTTGTGNLVETNLTYKN